jgi:hypothetical protein
LPRLAAFLCAPLLAAAALLPLPAPAQPPQQHGEAAAFCAALRRLAAAAASGFDSVDRAPHLVPGSVEERRGVTAAADGPPRAVLYAVMARAPSRQRPNPVAARFEALRAEVARCLPEAEAGPVTQGQGGAQARWTTPQAVIGLRRDDGEGFASDAELELSVASRW